MSQQLADQGVRYYNLPVDSRLRRKYQLAIEQRKSKLDKASCLFGERLSPDDIPDVICSEEQQEKFESLLKKTPSKSLKKKVVCVQRALVEANRETRGELKSKRKRKAPKERPFSPGNIQPVKKRRKTRISLGKENLSLQSQNTSLISEKKALSERVLKMEQLLQEMKAVQEKLKFERYSFGQKLKEMKFEFNTRSFTLDCLKIRENEFFLLCGLSVNEFDCLFACLMPVLHLIVYSECVQSLEKLDSNNKLLDGGTELLVARTVTRHAVDLVIMAKLIGGSSSIISRVFVA